MAKKNGFFAEFKAFAMKGNVMDMSVGIIIGAAFTAIVTSLVQDIITPLLSIILGHVSFADLSWNISSTLGIDTKTPIILAYGSFLQAVFNFLLVAMCIFLLIRGLNRGLDRLKRNKTEEEEATPPPISEDIALLTEIRDLLKAEKQS